MAARSQEWLSHETPGGLVAAMWRYCREDRALLVLAYAVCLLMNLGKLSLPLLVGVMINIIQVYGAAGLERCRPIFLCLLGVLAFLWIVRVPTKLAQFRIARTAQRNMIIALSRRLFAAPLVWHEARHSGDTASRMGQSSGAVFGFAIGQFGHVEALMMMIGPIIALYVLSPLICLCALGGYAIIAAICVGVDFHQRSFWVRESDAHRVFGTALVDTFRNIMTIYASRRQRKAAGFLEGKLQIVFAAVKKNVVMTEWKWSGIEMVTTAFGLGLMVVYILQYANAEAFSGKVELGNVYMVQAYVQGGMGALLTVVGNITAFMRQRTDFGTAAPIFAIQVEPASDAKLPSDWGELALEDLSYAHVSSNGPVRAVDAVDLTLHRGRHYALVGLNGSGKTTLLKLLSGLLRPDTGALRIDGAQADFSALRNSATLAPQQPELLNGTIQDNLFLDPTDAGGVEHARQATVLDLLISPLGVDLNFEVHEGGANWSGGQRQRIALARGLISALDSEIVLVDEPTSSIDTRDERLIIDYLRQQFRDRTLIASLHNLELINRFDAVIVIDGGRIIDIGPPDTVRRRCHYFSAVVSEEEATILTV